MGSAAGSRHRRNLIREGGYQGEKIIHIAPSDLPQLMAPNHFTHDLLVKQGMNVELQVMDWGTMVARRVRLADRPPG